MATQGTIAQRRAIWLWLLVGAAVIAAVVILVVVANGASQQNNAGPLGTGTNATEPATSPTDAATGAATPTPTPDASAPPPEESAPPAGEEAEPAPPAAQAPVALTEPAAPAPGVTFSVGAIEAVDGVANGPGEVAGPALRFSIAVRNDTAEPVSLASTIVNLFAGADLTPMTEVGEPGGVPLPDSVAPGQSATGVFVFNVPDELRDRVQVSVDYTAETPIVLFEGEAPR